MHINGNSQSLPLTHQREHESKIKDNNTFLPGDTIPRHDEVKCLIVNINRVSGFSLPEMILHCMMGTGPMSPDGGHMPLSSPVTKHSPNVTQY